jgi:heme exporter protein A
VTAGTTAPGPPAALLARGLVKRYGAQPALDGIDLEVAAGSFVLLLGPNGAGKSTLLRIFATLVRPTSGTLRIHGADPRQTDRAVLRRRIGLLSHQGFLYDHLTGLENLLFYGRLYGLPDPLPAAVLALRGAGLVDRALDPTRSYSRGMQQRLAIERALLHDPDVVLLDEPFTGLDRRASDGLENRLAALRTAGRTCVMTTHDLRSGLRLADRVVILAGGRLAADHPARELDPEALEALFREATVRGEGGA